MRFPLCLMAVIAYVTATSVARADTIRVPADQPTIQAGIDAAMPGDEVLVAPGTYIGAGNKNLEFHGKEIVVRSESGADVTIIDCEGLGRAFFLLPPLGANAAVSGFTIQNGVIGAAEGGGGMAILGSSPTIESCIFTRNSTSGEGGGAIVCQSSSSVIRDCTFDQNSASGERGGAIFAETSSLSLIRCRFTTNIAREGGAILMFDIIGGADAGERARLGTGHFATIDQCTFFDNEAINAGAMFVNVSTSSITNSTFDQNHARNNGALVAFNATIEHCQFTGNTATNFTGAMESFDCTVTDCFFAHNACSAEGGAVRTISSIGPGSSFLRCVFFENTANYGGAISVSGIGTIESCTMVRNNAANGSGVWVDFRSAAELTRSIVGFGILGAGVACDNQATADLSCCDVYGNQGGDWTGCIAGQLGTDGNIAADPLFCDLPGGNLTLCADSPCAPAQSGACELIGALDVGCGTCGVTALEPTTWGRIKALHGR